jgi:hypothetical protein
MAGGGILKVMERRRRGQTVRPVNVPETQGKACLFNVHFLPPSILTKRDGIVKLARRDISYKLVVLTISSLCKDNGEAS